MSLISLVSSLLPGLINTLTEVVKRFLEVEADRRSIVGTDLQQFEVVQVQRALRACSLHHVQVVKALLSISCEHTHRSALVPK